MVDSAIRKNTRLFKECTGTRGDLCWLTQNIIEKNASAADAATNNIRNMLQIALQQCSDDEKPRYQFALDHMTVDEFKEITSLLALGTQLTCNVVGNGYSPRNFEVRNGDVNESPLCYQPQGDYVFLQVQNLLRQIELKYTDPTTTTAPWDERLAHRKDAHLISLIRAGAEECYHAYQFKNQRLWETLKEASIKVYGEPCAENRQAKLREAMEDGSREKLKEFYENDPIEKDANLFLDKLQDKFIQTAERYQQAKRLRG